MSKPAPENASTFDAGGLVDPFAATIDLNEIIDVLRRQWPIIASVAAAPIVLGLIYLLVAAPRFTATASIMIDARRNQLFQAQQIVGEQPIDSTAMESHIEVLKSESVALAVIRNLRLVEDAEFSGARGGFLELFNRMIGTAPASEQIERTATENFLRNLSVKRIGLSYVIDVAYTSLNPARSAQVANAVAEAYLAGELESKYQTIKRAGAWLQNRIAQLRAQTSAAENAVRAFKRDNNIVDTGRGLMTDQQLTDVNSQLIAARAASAEAKARLDRIDDIARSEVEDATVADALKSSVITKLRTQYLELTAREAEWAMRFGANHQAVGNIRAQVKEIARAISEEVKRIAQTYRSDFEIAKAREASIENSLSELIAQNARAAQAQVALRDLESASQVSRTLHDSFLQRLMEATQQQTIPTSEARIVTAATEPLRKSAPKSLLVLAACSVVGLALGIASALARERLDRMFRVPAQVEDVTGVRCFGVLPTIEPATLVPEGGSADQHEQTRSAGLLRYAVNAPFTRFAETLRAAKVAADMHGGARTTQVIGIVSALPREGKTTIASNLAHLAAHIGYRTLLIDGDLRNPSLTRLATPTATEGLIEILTGARVEDEVIWTDPTTGLRFLPVVARLRLTHPAEILSSNAMADLLARQRDRYDYIFIDLPPIAPVVDVRAAAQLVDGFLLVVEWGRTARDFVSETIATSDVLKARLIGAVLNNAAPAALRRLETHKGRAYRNYYHDARSPAQTEIMRADRARRNAISA